MASGKRLKAALVVFAFLASARIALADIPKAYLVGGAMVTGGAQRGPGLMFGGITANCTDFWCTGYGASVGYTIRDKGITFADTLTGFSLGSTLFFAGAGLRTTESKKSIGQYTLGMGSSSTLFSIRRYSENSKNYTEAVLSLTMPFALQ
jgi:hypothetical protein